MSHGEGAAIAYYAYIAQAIKASGAIVRMEPDAFLKILKKDALVVAARGGIFKGRYEYITGYKGLVFFTKSDTPLALPDVEIINAKQIWIPG